MTNTTTAALKFGTVSVEVERIDDDTATLFTSTATHVIDPTDRTHPYVIQFIGTHDDGAKQAEAQILITRNGQPVSSFPTYLAEKIGLAIIGQGRDAELFADPHTIANEQSDAFRS